VTVTIVFLCNNMAVFAWPVSLGLIIRWYEYVVNVICTLRVACTVSLSYTGLSHNRYFHSPTISLYCITVTASDLWLRRISLTFPNGWFSSAVPYLAKWWTIKYYYSMFACRGLTCQRGLETGYVIS